MNYYPYHPCDWYIDLHVFDFYGTLVGKYTSPMDGMGFVSLTETVHIPWLKIGSRSDVAFRQQNKLAFFDGTWRWSSRQARPWSRKHRRENERLEPTNQPIETEDKSSKPPFFGAPCVTFPGWYGFVDGKWLDAKNTFATKSWNRLPLNNTCGHGNWTKKALCVLCIFEVWSWIHPIQAFYVAFTV